MVISTFQERCKAENINRKLRQQLTDYRVPDVMDYVAEKADLYELQKKVRSWERKVEIAEVRAATDVWKNSKNIVKKCSVNHDNSKLLVWGRPKFCVAA